MNVEKKIEGAILLPQVAGYPRNKVEIVASVHIKNLLGVRDGDHLTLEFKKSER